MCRLDGLSVDLDGFHARGRDDGIGDGDRSHRRRQVGEVSGGALQQAGHLDRGVRRHEELPFPESVAETAAESACARLELLGRDRARLPRGETQTNRAARRRLSRVVATRHGDRDLAVGGIDQAQVAHLAPVAARVEERNVLTERSLAHDLVHGGHEPVRGPDVRQGLDVEVARNEQAPIALPVAQPP